MRCWSGEEVLLGRVSMITLLYPCLTHVFRLTEGKPMTQAALLSIQGLKHLPPRHWGSLVSLSCIFCLTLIGQPCMPYSFKGPVSLSSCSAHMKNSILQCYHTGACGHTQEWPSTCLGGSELNGGGCLFSLTLIRHPTIPSLLFITSLVTPVLTSSLEAKQISSREGTHPSWEHNQTLRMILLKRYSLNFGEENQVSILLIIPEAEEGKEVGFPHEHWVLSMLLVLLWLQMVNEECHPIHPVIACLTRWAPGVPCWERGPLSIQPKQID